MRTTRMTVDRGPPGADQDTVLIDIHTNEQLGPHMSLLPNGSLLCRDVPIARVGWLVYGPGETPLPVGPHGVAYVERTADELFSPETIGSFMASTVTDNHPPGDVIPDNWKQVAKGFTTTNVRRGRGEDADVLLADLVITDKDLINQVRSGKREVSCGYESDYYQTGPGLGQQRNIRGNHIALVAKGRCGPRCSIRDHALHTIEGNEMTQRNTLKTARRALVESPEVSAARARASAAQAELDALQDDEDEGDGVHIHVHTNDNAGSRSTPPEDEDRIGKLETIVTGLADTVKTLTETLTPKAKTADELNAEAQAAALAASQATDDVALDPISGKTLDSAALATSYTQLVAQCEVLVPGFRVPTLDAAMKRKATVDQMCTQRRRCLELAYSTTDGQKLIDGVGATTDLDFGKMDCASTAILFNAAVALKAQSNNRSATLDAGRVPPTKEVAAPKMPTFADINDANQKFWAANSNGSSPA